MFDTLFQDFRYGLRTIADIVITSFGARAMRNQLFGVPRQRSGDLAQPQRAFTQHLSSRVPAAGMSGVRDRATRCVGMNGVPR